MKYKLVQTKKFEKDIKSLKKQNKDLTELFNVIDVIAKGETLDKKYRDHKLAGNFNDYRECHIENDFLLVYKIEKDKLILILYRTGTHSEIFGQLCIMRKLQKN